MGSLMKKILLTNRHHRIISNAFATIRYSHTVSELGQVSCSTHSVTTRNDLADDNERPTGRSRSTSNLYQVSCSTHSVTTRNDLADDNKRPTGRSRSTSNLYRSQINLNDGPTLKDFIVEGHAGTVSDCEGEAHYISDDEYTGNGKKGKTQSGLGHKINKSIKIHYP